MTGFTRRFLRWWNTRRGIAAALASDVASYLDAHLEVAESAPYDALLEAGEARVQGQFDGTASFPSYSEAMPASRPSDAAPRTSPARPQASYAAPASLDDLLKTLDASFSQTLLQMIDARGLTDSQVYRRAHLSRQHFSKIRGNEAYRPTKATVLALAIALELSLDETRLLLERAGFSLSHASKADVIVEYFIGRRQYDLNLVNRTLYHFDQPILGS